MGRWTNARGASPLLVVLAVLLVGGFLYWLNLQAQDVDRVVEPVPEGETDGEIPDFVPAQLVEAPEGVLGREGVLRDVAVAQSLGRGVLTIDLDAESSLPVLLAPDLIARGTTARSGDPVTIYGTIYALNDSIRGAWVERGAVDQGNADSVPETPAFLLADSLTFN